MNARSLVCFHENTWVTSHCFLVERFASFLTLLHHCQQRQFMLMSTYADHEMCGWMSKDGTFQSGCEVQCAMHILRIILDSVVQRCCEEW